MSAIRENLNVDSTFIISDTTDPTKELKFDVSGITTGNTRTLTVPNINATLVGTTITQTLTNKTINTANNTLDIAAGDVTSGTFNNARIAVGNVTQHEGSINHDNLLGYVANEHLDWLSDQGANNIHVNNITSGAITQHEGSINHDNLAGFVANEHIDWLSDAGANNIHQNNITAASVTQHEGSINHDNLSGFVANEHIDWVSDAGANNIHQNNITATSVTQHEGSLTLQNLGGILTVAKGGSGVTTLTKDGWLVGNGAGAIYAIKNKLNATTSPSSSTDDVTLGYAIGSRWFDITANKEYVCLDNTDGAAVWLETTIVNTISNVGTGGVGIYKQKTGDNFELKKINSTSSTSGISIVDDTGNNEVDIRLSINSLGTAAALDGTADYAVIYDASETGHKKILVNDLFGDDVAVAQLRRTTTHVITDTWTTITFDTTDVETDASVVEHDNTNTDRINILETGLYEIYYHVDAVADSGAFHDIHGKVMVNGVTLLPGSECSAGNYGTGGQIASAATRTIVANFTGGDYVTVQIQYDTAAITGTTLFDPTFRVRKMEIIGAQGPQGIPGSGSSVTVKNEGANVTNTPHTSLNFIGPGITAADGGSGISTVTLSESGLTLDNLGGTLSVSKGGIGTTSLTSGNILRGNGTGAITATLTAPSGAIVGTTDSQTLTNKTINTASNTITIAAADISSGTFADARIAASNVTQHSTALEGVINHDNLLGYVNKEHVDWTVDQGANNIHVNNITITGVTQHEGSITIGNLSGAPSGTVVGTTDSQTLTNKTFGDSLNMNSNKIINLTTPTADTDAASKAYVDGVASGLDVKDSVVVASTVDLNSNGSISGSITYNATAGSSGRGQITATLVTTDSFTIDGVNFGSSQDGSRILLKNQTTGAQNGIWTTTVSGTSLTLDRATDFDSNSEVTSGAFTFVEQGTTYDNCGFVLSTNDPIIIGGASGTSIAFTQFSGAGQITAGNGMIKTGDVMNVIGSTTIIANADSLEVNSSSTSNQVLLSSGSVGTASTYGALPLNNSNACTGTLPVSRGGSGATTLTSGKILRGNGTGAITATLTAPSGAIVGTSDTQTLTNKTLTSPIINQITTNGTEEILKFNDVGLAVNEFTINNAVTSSMPTLEVTGNDSIIGMNFLSKGGGSYDFQPGSSSATQVKLYQSPSVAEADVTLTVAASVTSDRTASFPNASGEVILNSATQTLTNKTINTASNTITIAATDITSGTLPLTRGGTGQTTKTAAFDGLAPNTTKGDLIVYNGSDNIRVAVGSNDQVLTADSAQASGVKWTTPTDGDVTAAANLTMYGLVVGDDGAKGIRTGTEWTLDGNGVLGSGFDYAGYILDVHNTRTVGGGNGFRIMAGEALGDIAFHVADADDTFQIMELEADQGYATFGKTYAQTLTDNGVVYGIDIEHPSGTATDFNTQAGTYRKGGVDCIMASGGTTGQVLSKVNGTDYNTQWTTITKTIRQGHTWAIGGEVKAASGDTDFLVPMYISLASGQTAKLVSCRYKINSGTSVTAKVQKNDVDVTGFTGLSVTTTATTTDPADVSLADGDELSIIVSSPVGTPMNMTFTIFVEHTV